MKAAYLEKHGGPSVVQVGELPTSEPGPGEVQVRMKYASLNHLDIWVREGFPGLQLKFPHILGSDGSGTIEKLGAKVTGFNVGDAVIVHPGLACGRCAECLSQRESLCPDYKILGEQVSGTMTEKICVPVENIFRKPSNVSMEEAAAFPLVFTTAWEMLVVKAEVFPGAKVLVHGAGSGVSMAAIQIAKLKGAHVTVTSRSTEKLDQAKKLGADDGLLSSEEFGKQYRKKNGTGPDIIVDHVGQVLWESNLKLLKSGGTLVTCGATSGREAKTDLAHVFFRQLRIWGSTMGSKAHFSEPLQAFAQGKLRVVLAKTFPLREIHQAQAYLEAGHQFGKVLISIE